MRNKLLLILVFYFNSICDTVISYNVKSYDGYSVIRFIPASITEIEYLQRLSSIEYELDFWSYPTEVNAPVDVMFPPHLKKQFSKLISEQSIENSLIISDVGELIEKQKKAPVVRRYSGFKREVIPGFWDDYRPLDQVFDFLDAIVAQYPQIASLEVIGKSYENRDIKLINIGIHSRHHKPIYFIDSNIHAREWITYATVTYFIQYLVDGYANNDPIVLDLLNIYDFYIIPVLNPDGFQYTHTNERLWRKTRLPNAGSDCVGTDPNRNFNHQWMTVGASSNPCSNNYGGAYPNDNPEVKALQDYLLGSRPVVYFAVHSAGQVLLFSWGNGTNLPPDYDALLEKGLNATAALTSVNGAPYRCGTITNLLYPAAGNAVDFAYEFCGSKYSYTIELRDTGFYGHLLPREFIIPSGNETVAFFLKLAQDVAPEARTKNKSKLH